MVCYGRVTTHALKRLGVYIGVVVLVAGAMRFVAYAAAVSIAAMFRLSGVDSRKIADHVQNTTGALGLIVAFALLAARH